MIPKLQDYMNDSRIPLVLRMRDGIIYYQLQIQVAREDGLSAGYYCEYEKVNADNLETIGKTAKVMLSRFHEIGDLTLTEFRDLTGFDNVDSYDKKEERLNFMEVKSLKELDESFDECGVDYDVKNNHYYFSLSWIYQDGTKKWRDSSDSTGQQGIFTFDKALEFDDDVDSEYLGEMILEAFSRSKKMSEVESHEMCPPKEVDLFGSIVEVIPPLDKHFADYGDAGVGEIYQYYAYLEREGAESSADFLLTMAPEIYEELSCDNIRSAWLEAYGEADELDVTETEYGIYQYRATYKNQEMFRIAYFCELDDGTALECCLEISTPSEKKELTEKLPALFEQFAINCKLKQ